MKNGRIRSMLIGPAKSPVLNDLRVYLYCRIGVWGSADHVFDEVLSDDEPDILECRKKINIGEYQARLGKPITCIASDDDYVVLGLLFNAARRSELAPMLSINQYEFREKLEAACARLRRSQDVNRWI